jgi:hypothetical protein
MYNTAKGAKSMYYCVKATGKLMKNNALVLILRNKDNCFITFTFNTLQP